MGEPRLPLPHSRPLQPWALLGVLQVRIEDRRKGSLLIKEGPPSLTTIDDNEVSGEEKGTGKRQEQEQEGGGMRKRQGGELASRRLEE